MSGQRVGGTDRLVLRRFTAEDAAFVLELLNEPGWLRFIGDRGVRTPADARAYIEARVLGAYARFGFGFYRVERNDGEPVGLCGLARRDGLDDVDIGFALLQRHAGRGFAYEAAVEVVRIAREELALTRLVAITRPDNHRSIALLEKLGMGFERTLRLPGEDENLSLYAMALHGGSS